LSPGRIRILLAKKLQRDVPDIRGKEIQWRPEALYRRQGRHLKFCDCYSWSGVAYWAGSGNTAGYFDCWDSMTACLTVNKLVIKGNEIVAND
jgi:hypothetical protein